MAGVAAETSAGDDTEALQPQSFAHRRHQVVELQPRGLGIFFELRTEEHLSTQPRQLVGGHVKVASLRTGSMAQDTVHLSKAIWSPGAEYRTGAGQNHLGHVLFLLFQVHFRPLESITGRPDRSDALGVATPQ